MEDRRDARERAQRERARGAFELWVPAAPQSEEQWRVLRRALRFPRSDDALLRRRVPGAVRIGAREDLLSDLERLRAAGIEAAVRPRSAGPGAAPS